jgi:hypothetical protein
MDSGQTVFSGWRTVAIGDTGIYGDVVPVVFTGSRKSAIDVVFVADSGSFSSYTDPQFLDAVAGAIYDAYYGFDIFLTRQDAFNFWIAKGMGEADGFSEGCDHDAPEIGWADVEAILHTEDIRDCVPSGRRLFSSKATNIGIIRHETGHRPFGLADEYCNTRNPPAGNSCDGGYFMAHPFPNLYNGENQGLILAGFSATGSPVFQAVPGCTLDAPNLGRTPSACASFREDVSGWFDNTWWVSEPHQSDLMVDNTLPQAADQRRINWLLDLCRSGAQC